MLPDQFQFGKDDDAFLLGLRIGPVQHPIDPDGLEGIAFMGKFLQGIFEGIAEFENGMANLIRKVARTKSKESLSSASHQYAHVKKSTTGYF